MYLASPFERQALPSERLTSPSERQASPSERLASPSERMTSLSARLRYTERRVSRSTERRVSRYTERRVSRSTERRESRSTRLNFTSPGNSWTLGAKCHVSQNSLLPELEDPPANRWTLYNRKCITQCYMHLCTRPVLYARLAR